MKTPFIGDEIIFLESIDSTNSYSIQAFKNGEIKSGTVVVADFQTHGKGQRDKTWQATSRSNLLMSITANLDLWKIKNIISLNHIVALSIQKLLRQHTTEVEIKWPNDIMVSDKKIAGILIETQITSRSKKAVIGFGININQENFEAPRATSLYLMNGTKYNPKEFVPKVIGILNEFIELYSEKGEKFIYHLFNQQLWKQDQDLLFESNGVEKLGRITSTTMDGRLIVKHQNQKKYYSNGEVKF